MNRRPLPVRGRRCRKEDNHMERPPDLTIVITEGENQDLHVNPENAEARPNWTVVWQNETQCNDLVVTDLNPEVFTPPGDLTIPIGESRSKTVQPSAPQGEFEYTVLCPTTQKSTPPIMVIGPNDH
jgi:hypothetical protein